MHSLSFLGMWFFIVIVGSILQDDGLNDLWKPFLTVQCSGRDSITVKGILLQHTTKISFGTELR